VEAGAVLGDICTYASLGYTTARAQELARLTGCALDGNDNPLAGALRDSLVCCKKATASVAIQALASLRRR
jgi:exodeoxyribonuclease V alpha subunit